MFASESAIELNAVASSAISSEPSTGIFISNSPDAKRFVAMLICLIGETIFSLMKYTAINEAIITQRLARIIVFIVLLESISSSPVP